MKRKIAFLFPGQGSQEVGMGRDLFGRDPVADRLIDRASEAAGVDLARMCIRGPGRELEKTENLQPALAALSLALAEGIVTAGVRPAITAGHSVGELPALAMSGIARPEDMVELAAVRGRLMGTAAKVAEGAMVAITGVGADDVFGEVESFGNVGRVSVAAVNAPNQVTVSGDTEAVMAVADRFRSEGRVTRLRVSGAWHSEQMRPALEPFRSALDGLDIRMPQVTMVFNRDGKEIADPQQARERLAGQLVRPVRFDLVMNRLLAMGMTDFVELGPGRVLRGLVRLNTADPEIRVHTVSDRRSLDRVGKNLI